MKEIVSFIFYIYLLSFSLPGNSINGIPIKQILFAMLVITILAHSFKNKNLKTIQKPLMMLFIPIIFIFVWWGYSVLSGNSGTPNEMFISFISLIGTCVIAYYFISNNIVGLAKAKKWLYISAFVKIIFTIFIEFRVMSGSMGFEELMSVYSYLDSTPVTMLISDLGMVRIATPSDSFPIVVLGFFIADKNNSRIIRFITSLAVLFFSFIVYSRFILFQTVCTIFIALVIGKFNFSKIIKTIIGTTFVLLFLFTVIPDTVANIYNSISFRLFSQEVVMSDNIRNEQQEVILQNISEKPIIGKGLGYYDRDLIRSEENLYSYELEYLSYIMQFGFLGFSLIIIMIIYSFYTMINFKLNNNTIRYLLYFNLLFWMLKPLFNPGFLSSNSGSSIASLFIISMYYFTLENNLFELRKKKFKVVWENKKQF